MYQISAQNWSFVVLNSLAKVNQNEVITFERLKISLNPFVGPLGLGQRPEKPLRLVSKTNPLWFFFSMGRCFRLKHAEFRGLGLLGPNPVGLLGGLGLLGPNPVGLWFGLGLLGPKPKLDSDSLALKSDSGLDSDSVCFLGAASVQRTTHTSHSVWARPHIH